MLVVVLVTFSASSTYMKDIFPYFPSSRREKLLEGGKRV